MNSIRFHYDTRCTFLIQGRPPEKNCFTNKGVVTLFTHSKYLERYEDIQLSVHS